MLCTISLIPMTISIQLTELFANPRTNVISRYIGSQHYYFNDFCPNLVKLILCVDCFLVACSHIPFSTLLKHTDNYKAYILHNDVPRQIDKQIFFANAMPVPWFHFSDSITVVLFHTTLYHFYGNGKFYAVEFQIYINMDLPIYISNNGSVS